MPDEAAALPDGPETYRAVTVAAYPSGASTSLVYSPEHRQVMHCDTGMIRLLRSCYGCRTLAGHAENILRAGVSGDAVDVRRGLDALVRAGLLQSGASLLAGESPAPPVEAPPDITTIGVITADRPRSLQRCLESFGRHCAARGRRPRFVVLDGSASPRNRALNRNTAARQLKETGHDVVVLSRWDARAIRDQVSRSCGLAADRQVGLVPGTAGANRNLLLLMTAGEHLLTVDDDVVCEPWARQGSDQSDQIVVSGHTDLRETEFFRSREAAAARAPRVAVDFMAAHSRLLGHSLAWLVRTSKRLPDLRYTCAHLMSRMAAGQPLLVRVTMSGVAGDSGFAWPERQLFASGVPRARLGTTADSYHTGLTYREVRRVADCHFLTHDPHCMAYCMGLANRTLLPPFPQAGRNEDGVFGALLLLSDPGTLFGHLPCGVIHASDRAARYDAPKHQSAAVTRLSELLICLIQRAPVADTLDDPATRLGAIAAFLTAVADAQTNEFESYVTHVLLDARYGELSLIEGATSARSEYPSYWKADLTSYRDVLLASVTRREFFVPIECREAANVDAGFRRTQQAVRDFARLLEHWPVLWRRFRHVRANRHAKNGRGDG